jgi:hypothetical protein
MAVKVAAVFWDVTPLSGTPLATFRRNLLPLSCSLKMMAAASSVGVTSLKTPSSYCTLQQYYHQDDHTV